MKPSLNPDVWTFYGMKITKSMFTGKRPYAFLSPELCFIRLAEPEADLAPVCWLNSSSLFGWADPESVVYQSYAKTERIICSEREPLISTPENTAGYRYEK